MPERPYPVADGAAPAIVSDHPFVARRVTWRLCAYEYPTERGRCNLAESAHAATTVRRGPRTLPYRCPDCVTKGISPCLHPYQLADKALVAEFDTRPLLEPRGVRLEGGTLPPGLSFEKAPPLEDARTDLGRAVTRMKQPPDEPHPEPLPVAEIDMSEAQEHMMPVREAQGQYTQPGPGHLSEPSGSVCARCGGVMRRTGTCETCESCGETSGCG